jgi:hypothetical protein
MGQLRIVEKYENEQWVRCQMKELREGDVFHMFDKEQDIKHHRRVGDSDYIATSNARLGINTNYPDMWGVRAEHRKN